MKAVVVSRFGPPETLQFREVPKPTPGPGEVLIRTKAIGLNFADVLARLGIYPAIPSPPFVPGIELSGIVETTGAHVRRVRKGDRVIAFSRQGAYAEFVCTNEPFCIRIPKRMSFQEAAAFSVISFSAYHGMITLAHLQRKEKMLLHAAAGGVGTAALQLARELDVEVFATVGSESKIGIARELGADHVINYATQDFEKIVLEKTGGYGVDVVMDSVGGSVFRKSWRLLAPMGRYILYGFAAVTGKRTLSRLRAVREALKMPLIYPPTLVSKNVALFGFNLYFLAQKVEYFQKVWSTLLRWYEQGRLHPVIGAVYPFDQIVEAQSFLQSRKSIGKVVAML